MSAALLYSILFMFSIENQPNDANHGDVTGKLNFLFSLK